MCVTHELLPGQIHEEPLFMFSLYLKLQRRLLHPALGSAPLAKHAGVIIDFCSLLLCWKPLRSQSLHFMIHNFIVILL